MTQCTVDHVDSVNPPVHIIFTIKYIIFLLLMVLRFDLNFPQEKSIFFLSVSFFFLFANSTLKQNKKNFDVTRAIVVSDNSPSQVAPIRLHCQGFVFPRSNKSAVPARSSDSAFMLEAVNRGLNILLTGDFHVCVF